MSYDSEAQNSLLNLPNDCKAIFMKNNLYKYSHHKKELENICLANFCSLCIKKFEYKEEKDGDNDKVDKLEKKACSH